MDNAFIKKYKNEFLGPEGENIDILIEKISYVLHACHARVKIHPDSAIVPVSERCIDYQKTLGSTELPDKGKDSKEVLGDIVDMLEGSQRLDSPNMAFNIAFTSPLLDAVAAMSAVALRNPSMMWDLCSGKAVAYEKKIARIFTELMGWEKSGDGVSTQGGKEAFLLGIKAALTRVAPETRENGIHGKYVVFTNQKSHFSIQHVCQYLGIGSKNCIKVPCNDKGEMIIDKLSGLMEKKIEEGFKIVAVMATGGATVDASIDWFKDIRDAIEKTKNKYSLKYTPFLYADTALGWPFIFFAKLNKKIKNHFHTDIDTRIDTVIQKMRQIKYADAFSVDFHKTAGVCPYNSGFLVLKHKEDLYRLAVPGTSYIEGSEKNTGMDYGKVRPHNINLQNSKGALGVATSWVALNRLGMQGIVDYVEYFLTTSEYFKHSIKTLYQSCFEVINQKSPFWEIVIKPHFFDDRLTWKELAEADAKIKEKYSKTINMFINHIWNKHESDGSMSIFISIIQNFPEYLENSLPALIISPTSLYYDENSIDHFIRTLVNLKKEFEYEYCNEQFRKADGESDIVPPR